MRSQESGVRSQEREDRRQERPEIGPSILSPDSCLLSPWGLLVMALGFSWASVGAAAPPSLEQRVQRLEQQMQGRGLIELMDRLDQLQREVQQLRGDVEVQGHALEQLKKRQRDLYVDIDRRLRQMEVRPAPATQGAVPEAPPTAAAASAVSAGAAAATVVPKPAAAGGEAASEADAGKIRQAYEDALNILREGRYEQAAEAFRKFLAAYPDSSYAANAQYWLAETYYVTRKFEAALAEFAKVLENYPGSVKTADAKLKMGFIQYELGNWAEARKWLEAVQREFPKTTAARLAAERLERMRREGH